MSSNALPLVRGVSRGVWRVMSPAIGSVRTAQRTRVLTLAALGVVYVVWGSSYLAIEVALGVLPPFLLLAARFAVAGTVLLAFTHRRGRPVDAPALSWRCVGQAAANGGLLLGLGTGLVVLAQTRLSSGLTALLAASVPLWLALLARGMLGERLSGRAWVGVLVGLLGVGLLVDPRGGGTLTGMLLVLVGSLAWAYGSVRGRQTRVRQPPLVAASLEMLAAAVLFLGVGLAAGEASQLQLGSVDAAGWLALAYLTFAGSLVGFTAYRWLLLHARTALVGSFAYVNPVVAVGLGWLVLGERFGARVLLAGGLVVVAVLLLVTGRPGQPIPAQISSGGDVFVGTRRWHRVRHRLGRLPGVARLYVDPHAPQYRDVGYPQSAEVVPAER